MHLNTEGFLKRKGIPAINGEKFRMENHLADNRIIFHVDDILEGKTYDNIVGIVGYSKHPAYREGMGIGLMFETKSGEELWCHYYG